MKKLKLKKEYIRVIIDILVTLFLLAMATAFGYLFSSLELQETNVVVVYILSVLLTSLFTRGYVYGIFASIASILLFNYFFTEPFFTLKVNNPVYFITFFIMAATSIITSALTTKVKRASIISHEKEYESNVLYKMTNLLTDANTQHDIASIICKSISDILSCNAAIVCFNEQGEAEPSFIQQKGDSQIRRQLDNPSEMKERMYKLHLPYDLGKEFCDYPIYDNDNILAVLRIPSDIATNMSEAQTRMTHSVIESTSMAMERLRSLKAQAKSREEATQERYKGNLLRAISHDIRTPLSGIMGSGEMLMGMTKPDDPRYEIAKGIYSDADWLHSLVENILNLTKLQDGRLKLNKEPEAIEEVIGAAISAIEKRAPGYEIKVDMPDELILVPMDAKLISQVIINLLDNAIKHDLINKEILIRVKKNPNEVSFEILDRGTGIAPEAINDIFKMFYTTRGNCVDSERGIGLGLAICESIVEAHGGKIKAMNRTDGEGACFSFTLPLGGDKNE